MVEYADSLPAMNTTRRHFLASTTAATLSAATHAFAAPAENRLKLALVGCGGRGTGAANQNLNTTKDVKLVAMADISRERLEKSLQTLKTQHAEQVDVSMANQFIGFEAYKEAIALA